MSTFSVVYCSRDGFLECSKCVCESQNRLFDSSSSSSSRYIVVSDDEKLYAAAENRFCAAYLI